jgi:hypothetical protein
MCFLCSIRTFNNDIGSWQHKYLRFGITFFFPFFSLLPFEPRKVFIPVFMRRPAMAFKALGMTVDKPAGGAFAARIEGVPFKIALFTPPGIPFMWFETAFRAADPDLRHIFRV